MDNQPIQSTPPPPSSPNPSKTFLLIIGAIALMAISGTGGYYLGTNKQSSSSQPPNQLSQSFPTPTVTPTPDETANWKTYTNDASRFSFKYPGNQMEPCYSDSDNKITSFYEPSLDCNLKPNSSSLLEVFVYDPEKFIIETIELGRPVSSKKLQLSGREFTIDEYTPGYKKRGEKVIIAKTRLSEKTVLELSFSLNQVLKKVMVDQILSTFQFLN